MKDSTLAIVLAGGKGERLHPLTLERTKPSVPFGGKYRIIDFALSNLINSGIYSMYVLVQYKSQSLIEHIRTSWRSAGVLPQHFITVVPPQMRREDLKEWYRGTADSVYQNINLIYDFKPKTVAIFGGDHVYRMNVKHMVDFHNKNKADLTISTIPIKASEANQFGILDVDDNSRITNFREKPDMVGDDKVLASMGNYIFSADVLVKTLEEMSKKSTTHHDFGKDIIPYLIEKKAKVCAYDFSKNRVPSLKKGEYDFYWKDVGTIESYWQANMDLLGKSPKLNLANSSWPIFSSKLNATPAYIEDSKIDNSFICKGSRIHKAHIKNSIIGRSVTIEEGCEISDSIIMDFSVIKKKSKIKKVIIDRFNVVDNNSSIGFNGKSDAAKYFVDPSGIVVLKREAHNRVFHERPLYEQDV